MTVRSIGWLSGGGRGRRVVELGSTAPADGSETGPTAFVEGWLDGSLILLYGIHPLSKRQRKNRRARLATTAIVPTIGLSLPTRCRGDVGDRPPSVQAARLVPGGMRGFPSFHPNSSNPLDVDSRWLASSMWRQRPIYRKGKGELLPSRVRWWPFSTTAGRGGPSMTSAHIWGLLSPRGGSSKDVLLALGMHGAFALPTVLGSTIPKSKPRSIPFAWSAGESKSISNPSLRRPDSSCPV